LLHNKGDIFRVIIPKMTVWQSATDRCRQFLDDSGEDSGMFFATFLTGPTPKSANVDIGRISKGTGKAADMGLLTIVLETRPTDTMVQWRL
jgi:hypothetical protein